MDDGVVSILNKSNDLMVLIDIKEKDFEIIQILNKINGYKLFKLLNQKIIMVNSQCSKIRTYVYENRKLTSVNEKELLSTKKISLHFSHKICLINEKEIALYYYIEGNFSDSYYIGFFDLKKDKKIQSFGCDYCDAFYLINENLFIYASKNKLYPIHLKNHIKKKEFKIENDENYVETIFSLNKKQFIASNEYTIYQFELEKDNNFTFIHKIDLENSHLLKYPENRLIFSRDNYKDGFMEIYLYS